MLSVAIHFSAFSSPPSFLTALGAWSRTFRGVGMNKEAVRAWMDAVLGSEHKGAALEEICFRKGEEEDEEDGLGCALALLDGARRGAYPNQEHFDTYTPEGPFFHLFFHLTDETIDEYIDALGEDFPWSGTLKSLSVRWTGSGAVVTRLPELRALLGGAYIYCTDV